MKRNMILISVIIFIVSGILFLICLYNNQKQNGRSQSIYVKINKLELKVQLADNFGKRLRGLSDKEKISDREGMFFIFNKPGYYPFWMKDINFPLDIIWFDENLKVIEIKKNLQPNSFPQTYQSAGLAKYVLEINAGLSDQYDIKRGDKCFLDDI